MTLTKALMYAAAMDAYKAAQRAGKTQDEANEAHQDTFDRLFEFIGGVEAWIDLPAR